MDFILFNVLFIIMHLLTTFAAATLDDVGNRDIANITIPDRNANATVSADDTVDPSKWILTYCNKPYDPAAFDCRGDCTTWNVAKPGADGIGDTPDTNCVYTFPAFQVTFKVCAGPTRWYHCHWSDVFHPRQYKLPDGSVVSAYNTISTGAIYLSPKI
jgi:hypothetical protein